MFHRKQNDTPAIKSKKISSYYNQANSKHIKTPLSRPIITLFHIKPEEKKIPKNNRREKEKAPLNILMLDRSRRQV